MNTTLKEHFHFLIIDGYPKESRDELQEAGMGLAWALYARMLQQHLPEATYDVLLPSDPGVSMPDGAGLEAYQGIIWTGCNLTIYEVENPSVRSQLELARQIYEIGIPSFGSCWGLQIAAVAAGGEVQANPRGREMGVARKIHLTPQGIEHPMYRGKSPVFDGFISHVDEVTKLPPGSLFLAGNDFTQIQAAAVTHKKGTFWATQYHTEYDLHEVARLFLARTPKLLREQFVSSAEELAQMVERMEALFADPTRKDLRWQLAIDDDLLADPLRQCEFVNWLNLLVLPSANQQR